MEEVYGRSQTATSGGQDWKQVESEQDLDHMTLLGSMGRVLWGSGVVTLANSNQNHQGLGKLREDLTYDTRGRLWEQGQNVRTGVVREVESGT